MQGLCYDPLEQANILNAHFAIFRHKSTSNMPNINRKFCKMLTINWL